MARDRRGGHSRSGSLRPLYVRIVGRLELDAQRCPVKLEFSTKPRLEITPIRIGNGIQRVAMDHDERWILPTLVRIPHFGTEDSLAWRLLLLDRRVQHSCKLRRRELGKCGGMGGIDRLDQSVDSLPVQSRDRMHFGEGQETQLTLEFA